MHMYQTAFMLKFQWYSVITIIKLPMILWYVQSAFKWKLKKEKSPIYNHKNVSK